MRDKSTLASVWPARTSTPPLRARSGKMWPGRARSCGRVFGSMAVRMVMARSEALMPVVTPRRPSMASVKAVPWTEVLIGDISGRWSSSQRSSVSGRQIRPRRVLGHEVDGFGGDFFGGHGEVAFVFAVFVVDEDDHASLANFFDGFFDGGELV